MIGLNLGHSAANEGARSTSCAFLTFLIGGGALRAFEDCAAVAARSQYMEMVGL